MTLNAGAADAYAQIGHGGASVSGGYGTGEARGNIEILNTTGKIGLYGGTGLRTEPHRSAMAALRCAPR